ncbi:hypothetical protein B0H15DRAFT_835645 [Mycena belliarum]|uniref:Uncharacterized protein n=1 Tax=Mycena belliarum TaxID=1033014 RepID=A0AAD6U8H0_9AGAR|nr:hypothetical protein B0H15DRAFT_835645 [Mycena belliae]
MAVSGLASNTSAGSLHLSHYGFDDSLLHESLTLSSLSSSTSSTPPIPAGCMVPLSTIIGHHEGPTMFRSSRRDTTKATKATLTSPTPPRLRTMLREKLLVETWLNTVDSDSSDHTPWEGIGIVDAGPWKSEGSIHAPDAFKTKLAFARRRHAYKSMDQDPTPSISITAPMETCRRAVNRNALVFEREIIFDSAGKSRRLSLRAPAKSMDPEVVEMISELQNLSSFFKKQEANSSDSPIAPQPPALIVSNSHFSLPVSLESSGSLAPGIPLALAARRGKKMLPPLSFKQPPVDNEYPSMPSAFLGSPSVYSPKFEFASNPNRSSMDLQQMVTSLRSQCASIDSDIPVGAAVRKPLAPAAASGEDDEWGFADGLLDLYHSRPFDSDFIKKPLVSHMVDYAEESLADTPLVLNDRRPTPVLHAPPSTPLPPCPASQRASVRSILKSSKSVRFASLPNERPASVEVLAVRAPRRSLGSSSPRKQPLPPRPKSHTVRSTIPASLRSPPPKTMTTPGRSSGQRRATTPAGLSSPVSSPVRTSVVSTRSPPKGAAFSGRHSLGRVFSTAKENKPDSPNPPTPTRTRWTLNENVLRRASISGPDAQKSRMPVPLRNILTRFK